MKKKAAESPVHIPPGATSEQLSPETTVAQAAPVLPEPPKVNIPLLNNSYIMLPKHSFKIICIDDENIILKITPKELTVRTIEDQ